MAEQLQQTVDDLGKLVKQKYPGSYDSIADADLGRQVKEIGRASCRERV